MNELLPHCYCINLASRPERWARAQAQFASIGLTNVQRFEAVQPPPVKPGRRPKGWVGCMLSHLGVLRIAPRNAGPIAVFEDDVEFLTTPMPLTENGNGPGVLEIIRECIAQAPANWDMIYLGGNPLQFLHSYSPNLLRVPVGLLTTHAMIYNGNSEVMDFILKHDNRGTKIDDFLSLVVQPKFNVFITYPLIATQHDGQSDVTGIENKYRDLIIENYNIFCPK